MSPLSIILLYSVKQVIFRKKYTQISENKQDKAVQNHCKQISWWILMWHFSLKEVLLWITASMDSGILATGNGLQLKYLNNGFVSCKRESCHFPRHELMDWIRVDYFRLWRHPFTSEDPMVSKWCNANFLKVCSNEEKNSTLILDDLRMSKF